MNFYNSYYNPLQPSSGPCCDPILVGTEYVDCTVPDEDDPNLCGYPVLPIIYENRTCDQQANMCNYGSSVVLPPHPYNNIYPCADSASCLQSPCGSPCISRCPSYTCSSAPVIQPVQKIIQPIIQQVPVPVPVPLSPKQQVYVKRLPYISSMGCSPIQSPYASQVNLGLQPARLSPRNPIIQSPICSQSVVSLPTKVCAPIKRTICASSPMPLIYKKYRPKPPELIAEFVDVLDGLTPRQEICDFTKSYVHREPPREYCYPTVVRKPKRRSAYKCCDYYDSNFNYRRSGCKEVRRRRSHRNERDYYSRQSDCVYSYDAPRDYVREYKDYLGDYYY